MWVEASIYQLDEDNEQRTGRGEEDPDGAADTGGCNGWTGWRGVVSP